MAENERTTEEKSVTVDSTPPNFALNCDLQAADSENTAHDFARLFSVDPQIQLNEVESLVDNLLAYVGESCSINDKVREETETLLSISMPQFYEKKVAMNKIFTQIDALEEFISAIKSNVDDMEQSVQLAEKQLGSKHLKKIISSIPIPSFFTQKKQVQSAAKTGAKEEDPEVPQIFETDDFFM